MEAGRNTPDIQQKSGMLFDFNEYENDSPVSILIDRSAINHNKPIIVYSDPFFPGGIIGYNHGAHITPKLFHEWLDTFLK